MKLTVHQMFTQAEVTGEWGDLQIELVRRWDDKSPGGDTAARFATVRRLYNAEASKAGDVAVGRRK